MAESVEPGSGGDLSSLLLGEAAERFLLTEPSSSLGDLDSFPAQGPWMDRAARSSFLGPPIASMFLSGFSCLVFPP